MVWLRILILIWLAIFIMVWLAIIRARLLIMVWLAIFIIVVGLSRRSPPIGPIRRIRLK